ncbi:MAG TPA: hypothetical protein VL970_13370, partial [Candidatus Acidoferrales bacterium]|nr:hypothetical protein [Candidatus Acidoferrales bacterium]
FRLPQELGGMGGKTFSSLAGADSGNYKRIAKFAIQATIVLVVVLVIFGRSISVSRNHEAAPVAKLPAPPRPLELGATGTLFNKKYQVSGHAVVDIAEVGVNWERHEYELTDDSGATALLVCGDKPDGADWIFFEPLIPMISLTAKEAAAKKVGDVVEIDGFGGKVTDIFLSTLEQTEGMKLSGIKSGAISYGLRGIDENRVLLARWNDAGIQYYRGRILPAKKGAACFVKAP